MGILSRNTIETWIIPHLTVGSRGFDPTVPIHEIIEAILHRLKTGCQWRELPTKQFFSDTILKRLLKLMYKPHNRSLLRDDFRNLQGFLYAYGLAVETSNRRVTDVSP